MAGDGDELQSLSIRMSTAEREADAINSTLDGVVQELKRLFLKINDQNLADGTYRSGCDRSSTNLPPPLHPLQRPLPYHPSTNFSQPPLLYTFTTINESVTCLFRYCNATKRPLILCNNIISFTQGARSGTNYATSSLITEAARTSF